MPPIHMTPDQRAALWRLTESPLPAYELPGEHAEKFINHGLAVRETLRIRITERGQLELLRQRFRSETTRLRMRMRAPEFLARFGQAIHDRSSRLSRAWRVTGEGETAPADIPQDSWYQGLRAFAWRMPVYEGPRPSASLDEMGSGDHNGPSTPASAA
ncbi:MAG: hypothetical protein ACR2PO_04635 [Methyloligellaceae bacterium]